MISAVVGALLLVLSSAAWAQSSTNYPIQVNPSLTFTPSSLSFPAGFNDPPQTFVLANGGGPALAVSTITISGANAADFSYTSNCPPSLASHAVCQINVTFAPTAAAGESATLTISSQTTGHTYEAALTGGGPGAPFPVSIVLNPSSGIITPDNTSAGHIVSTASVTTNDGSPYQSPLTIAPATIFAICGLNVCTARQLTSADDGSWSGIVTAASGGASVSANLQITVSPTAAPQVSFTPSSLSFGSQRVSTVSAPQTLTANNIGNVAETISATNLTGANPEDFAISSNTCSGTLAVNASCSMIVTFTPGSPGAKNASVSIMANDGPFTAALSGTATSLGAPTLSLAITPSTTRTPSTTPVGAAVAALQAVWSDGSPFTGSYIFTGPLYDSVGFFSISGNEVIIDPNGPGAGNESGTTQAATVEAVQLDPTADGVTSTAPAGPPLVNSAGYWSWSARQIGANYVLYLNGQQHAPSDAATLIEVANGGQLYAFSTSGWMVWNGSTFVSSGGP